MLFDSPYIHGHANTSPLSSISSASASCEESRVRGWPATTSIPHVLCWLLRSHSIGQAFQCHSKSTVSEPCCSTTAVGVIIDVFASQLHCLSILDNFSFILGSLCSGLWILTSVMLKVSCTSWLSMNCWTSCALSTHYLLFRQWFGLQFLLDLQVTESAGNTQQKSSTCGKRNRVNISGQSAAWLTKCFQHFLLLVQIYSISVFVFEFHS